MLRELVAASALLVAGAPSARADSYAAKIARIVRTRLDELALAKAPRLVPPTPVTIKWKAVRLGSLDLGAPLVATTGADLDGDGKSELYAVTTRDVLAIGMRGTRPVELGRVAFSGERATPMPRDPIGTATVEGGELVAAVSTWARELRIGWTGKALAGAPGAPGFLACAGERIAAVPGRNYFLVGKTPAFGVRCATLVDREGYPLRVRAQLAVSGKLAVDVQRCAVDGGSCQPAGSHEYKDVGVAFELADVDRDGTPEVIISGAGAPGDPDAVKVLSLGSDDKRGLHRKAFNGGVAGIVALDADGDGVTEVIALVRFAGATRVDLWRLD